MKIQLVLAVPFSILFLSSCTVKITEEQLFHPGRLTQPPESSLQQSDFRGNNVAISLGGTKFLRGWHLRFENPKALVIYFYGNGENLAGARERLFALARKTHSEVVAFDYPGYGFSDGTPSLHALAHDALRVFDFVQQSGQSPPLPIFVYGRSIGCGPAVVLGASRPIRGVILVAPPSSVADVIPTWSGQLPGFAQHFVTLEPSDDIKNYSPQPIDLIKSTTAPLLIVHGTDDNVIPIEFGRKMFDAAGSKQKEFLVVPAGTHNSVAGVEGNIGDRIVAFIDRNVEK